MSVHLKSFAAAVILVLSTASVAAAQGVVTRPVNDTLTFLYSSETRASTSGESGISQIMRMDAKQQVRVIFGRGDSLSLMMDSSSSVFVRDGAETSLKTGGGGPIKVSLSAHGVVTRAGVVSPDDNLVGLALRTPMRPLIKGTAWADTIDGDASPGGSNRKIIRREVVGDSAIAGRKVVVIAVTGTRNVDVPAMGEKSAANITTTFDGRQYYSTELAMVLKGTIAEVGATTINVPLQRTTASSVSSISLIR
jgi:hypothetical protein